MTHYYMTVPSPVGELKLVSGDNSLKAILWENDDPKRVRIDELVEDREHPALVNAAKELGEYFSGRRKIFDLELDFDGTDFQKRVWTAMRDVPYGATRSYADIADAVGNPRAVRAVGAACGRNPISIVAPCHRIVGSRGDLTGFAGGLGTKRYLLSLEQENAAA